MNCATVQKRPRQSHVSNNKLGMLYEAVQRGAGRRAAPHLAAAGVRLDPLFNSHHAAVRLYVQRDVDLDVRAAAAAAGVAACRRASGRRCQRANLPPKKLAPGGLVRDACGAGAQVNVSFCGCSTIGIGISEARCSLPLRPGHRHHNYTTTQQNIRNARDHDTANTAESIENHETSPVADVQCNQWSSGEHSLLTAHPSSGCPLPPRSTRGRAFRITTNKTTLHMH